MSNTALWIGVGILVLAGLNLWATLSSVRDPVSTTRQKCLQLLVTWLLPVLGAVATLAVRRFASRQKDRNAGDSSLAVEDRHYIGRGYF